MNLRRIILSFLTLVALVPIILSLVSSFKEPQVQTDLQLYQTNLVLQASEINLEETNFATSLEAIIGKETEQAAIQQYETAQTSLQKNLVQLLAQKDKLQQQMLEVESSNSALLTPQLEIDKKIKEQRKALNQVIINLGIIQAANEQKSQAIDTWNQVEVNNNPQQQQLLKILNTIWQTPQPIDEAQKEIIDEQLSGWFRYKVLNQIYQFQEDSENIPLLAAQIQKTAQTSLIKLLFITIIPLVSGAAGIVLLIFLCIQLFTQKEEAVLSYNQGKSWQVPWEFEITWQVLVIGFFLVAQILLPLIFSLVNINIAQLSLRSKAVYVLVSYLLMTTGGLSVLYFSIQAFFPLPSDWFNFKLNLKDLLWGIGGYLVALPLVVLVSLINQQIWQGQGGSNPLLSLALESQDFVVLGIFFFTASIAAPFFEEMMFRGFLLPSLTRYFSLWGAIFISGLIFAFAHLNLSEVLPLLVLGMVLGFVYSRSRNLLSSMLLHALWNSGTLLSLFILGSGA
ncbi:MAG: lysostaphin resistance A-like protein [Microcystaceae cyanobacterium]